MGCSDFIIFTYLWSLHYDTMLWVSKYCHYLNIFIAVANLRCMFLGYICNPYAEVSRHGRTRVIYHFYIVQCIPTIWRRQH